MTLRRANFTAYVTTSLIIHEPPLLIHYIAMKQVKRGGAIAPGGGGYGGYGSAGYGGYGTTGGSAGAVGGYGGINEAAAAAQAANELGSASYVAHAASQAAVANVVRNDYNAQLATTAQFVAQYTAPVN